MIGLHIHPLYAGQFFCQTGNRFQMLLSVIEPRNQGTAEHNFSTGLIEPAKIGQNPLETFQEAFENVMPLLEVKARRVGGSTYQVPMEVRAERRQTLGLRWMVSFARTRGERTMSERLAAEIIDAKNSAGGAFKKKEETHRMADANKAFAHFKY